MKRNFRVASGVVFVGLLLLTWVFFAARQGSRTESAYQSGSNGAPVAVPTDTDWDSFEEEALRSMIDQLGSEGGASSDEPDDYDDAPVPGVNYGTPITHFGKFSAVVADGETLVTEGYEKSPGVFVFTSLTPEASRSDDGEEFIALTMRRFEVSFTEEESPPDQSFSMFLKPGGKGMISISSEEDPDSGVDQDDWGLEIAIDQVAGGFSMEGASLELEQESE